MACKCRERRTRPLGSTQPQSPSKAAAAAQREAGGGGGGGTSVAGKASSTAARTQRFTLTDDSGRVQTFATRLERDAAAARLRMRR